jgi:hypothetical protein
MAIIKGNSEVAGLRVFYRRERWDRSVLAVRMAEVAVDFLQMKSK